ncbi:MAG: hypothetical protein KatS3mg008_0572 [Acidimicrobiales bacterium]|nr:MAG: hypothetical protein KatS3mg008_0572 [Acidimicrobiales bacterium]
MLTVLTNAPSPNNRVFFAALARLEEDFLALYESDPAGIGRPWRLGPGPEGVIASAIREMAILTRRSGDFILSGGWSNPREMMRLPACALRGRTHWWGERLRPARGARRMVRRRFLRSMESIFAIGSWAVPGYRDEAGAVPIHVFPYVTSGDPSRREIADEPTFGFAGQLIERKGVDLILAALAELAAEGLRPVLEVAGSGPLDTQLRRSAERLDVRVRWLGELDQQDLALRRRRWWAQVVPSRYDGWGAVVSEALADGVPVLASPWVGAAWDLVRDGWNGEIVPEGSWKAALERWCDRRLVESASEAAAVVGEAFDAEHAATWLLEVLREDPTCERDFVAETWRRLDAATSRSGESPAG